MTYTVRRHQRPRNEIHITKEGERIDLRKLKMEGGRITMSRGERQNKYGAHSATFMGRKYHSTAEAEYAQGLELRKRAGEIKEWTPQFKVPLYVHEVLISTYYADFFIVYADGSEEIVEVKGCFTEYARLKWKLFTVIYAKEKPWIKITMIKV